MLHWDLVRKGFDEPCSLNNIGKAEVQQASAFITKIHDFRIVPRFALVTIGFETTTIQPRVVGPTTAVAIVRRTLVHTASVEQVVKCTFLLFRQSAFSCHQAFIDECPCMNKVWEWVALLFALKVLELAQPLFTGVTSIDALALGLRVSVA